MIAEEKGTVSPRSLAAEVAYIYCRVFASCKRLQRFARDLKVKSTGDSRDSASDRRDRRLRARRPLNLFRFVQAPPMASSSSPPQSSVLFARGVIARLAYWPALRIAVDQGWGGPESAEKRTWLASVLVDDFEEQDPQPDLDYVEDRLLQVMADEFDANLEDGSAEVVAKDIVRLWEEVSVVKTDLLKDFEDRAEKLKGKKIDVEEAAGDNSDWEDMSDDEEPEDEALQLVERQRAPKEQPEVDEDGFTTVKGKSKSHR